MALFGCYHFPAVHVSVWFLHWLQHSARAGYLLFSVFAILSLRAFSDLFSRLRKPIKNLFIYLCTSMIKWLTFLLLLVTTTATFYPCCSKDDCCNDVVTPKATNHSNHKSEGNCSPFITCGTCPGFTQMASIYYVPVVTEEKPVHHEKVFSLTLSSYTASLLQPPRIA